MLAPHGVKVGSGDGRPAAFLADASNRLGVAGVKIINRLLRRFGDVAQGMNADFELVGRMSARRPYSDRCQRAGGIAASRRR